MPNNIDFSIILILEPIVNFGPLGP